MGKTNTSGRVASAALLAAGASAVLAAPGRAQGINVTVDGNPVAFTGQPAMEQNGNVLVPLRGVFERLGAEVLYDTATRRIVATKGATTVQLTLGQTAAVVNGQPRTLSVPAMAVNGTTLVPLRFVSEALGANVDWNGASRTVFISTGAGSPQPPTGSNPGAPSAPAAPAISSLTHNGRRTLRVGETLTVTVVGTPGAEGTFSISGLPSATDLPMKETTAGTYVGTFTVPIGASIRQAPVLARLTRGNNASPSVQAAQPLTVGGGAGRGTGNAGGAGNLVQQLTFTPANRRLEPGDVLTVQLRARPGGTARYRIGSLVEDRPLREQSPGVYVGTYTMKRGDRLSDAQVSASFSLNGRTVTETADQTISTRGQ